MATKVLLTASHLALVASALIGGAESSFRQRRHFLPRTQLAPEHVRGANLPPATFAAKRVGGDVSLASATSEKRSPEEVARLEERLYELAKQANEQARTGTRSPRNSTATELDFEVSGTGGRHEVDKLEEVVIDLVKKHRNGKKEKDEKATPMGPSVSYIKGIIDNTMLPNRETAHRQDQAALDKTVRDLEGCAESRRSLMRLADSPEAAYEDASSRHHTCRLTESGDFMEKEDMCRETLMQVKRMQRDMTCAKVEETKKSCEYSNYQAITDAILECDRVKKVVVDAQALCDQTRARYERTKQKCDHYQSIMDESSCTRAVRVKEACEDGDSCYRRLYPVYEHTLRIVENDEMARGAEWRALKRMQCLMDTFSNDAVTDDEIDACKRRSHSPPLIIYPEPPSNDPCTVPGKYPGTAAYKKAEFDRLPPQAKGRPEAGNCYAMPSSNSTKSGYNSTKESNSSYGTNSTESGYNSSYSTNYSKWLLMQK